MARVGVRPVEGLMPCQTTELEIEPYILPIPGYPTHAQEAAARLLLEGIARSETGEWVAVTWKYHLLPRIQHDRRACETAALQRQLADTLPMRRCKHHTLLTVLTLGVHAHACDMREKEEVKLPHTHVLEMDEHFIIRGLEYLIRKRDVHCESRIVGLEENQFFSPTPQLIHHALRYSTIVLSPPHRR